MNTPNPLEYHYETSLKLDYFILSANIALLGWTIVNTNWMPKCTIFIWLIGGFWTLLILSIISGIIRQLYNGIAFGLNYQILQAGETASVIEKNSLQDGNFINQQTRETMSNEEFKKFATPHREKEKKGEKIYDKIVNKSVIFGNLAIILLVAAIFLFAGIKIYTLTT
jgi:hypothetical protein